MFVKGNSDRKKILLNLEMCLYARERNRSTQYLPEKNEKYLIENVLITNWVNDNHIDVV